MASLSERLKRERELRGISLKQISEETRIGVRFLQALEDDRLEVIPGEFYRRSYLRAYTRYLGLDEDRALNVYDFSRKEKSSTVDGEGGSGTSLVSIPNWIKWVFATLVLGLPLVFLLRALPATTGANDPLPEPRSEPELQRAPILPRETSPAAIGLPPSPFPAESLTVESGLHLVLSVEESCWLEIVADGEVVVSGLKEQGFRQEVTAARELRLWLGNAGGVKVLLNDQPAIPFGRPGQVRKDLTITIDNYKDFVSRENRS